jgi:hypothetical protein
MACCGLCRPKIKSTNKPKKNINIKKINAIDMWMENIEGPYELIDLPTQPPDKPIRISNREEIDEVEEEEHDIDRTMKSARQNLHHLSSDMSTSENDSFSQRV